MFGWGGGIYRPVEFYRHPLFAGAKNAQTAEARFDAMVQQVPTWQLMAEHEPKLFSELRNQVVVLMKAGANEQKIIDTIQPRFSALQMQRMPLASDQLVVAETRVLIDQTVEMQKSAMMPAFVSIIRR